MNLIIRAVSGSTRGVKGSGEEHRFSISKDIYLALCEQIYDLEVAAMKPDNAKSGGAVSQLMLSYGASADKQTTYKEKTGMSVFPTNGGEFTAEHIERWLECMELKKPRTVDIAAQQAKWDANAACMRAAGLSEDFIVGALKKRPVAKAE